MTSSSRHQQYLSNSHKVTGNVYVFPEGEPDGAHADNGADAGVPRGAGRPSITASERQPRLGLPPSQRRGVGAGGRLFRKGAHGGGSASKLGLGSASSPYCAISADPKKNDSGWGVDFTDNTCITGTGISMMHTSSLDFTDSKPVGLAYNFWNCNASDATNPPLPFLANNRIYRWALGAANSAKPTTCPASVSQPLVLAPVSLSPQRSRLCAPPASRRWPHSFARQQRTTLVALWSWS